MESKVLEVVKRYDIEDRVIISSFNPKSVERMVQLTDRLEVALLRSRKHSDLVMYAKQLGAQALHINYRLLNKQLVAKSREQNMPLRVYTVNRRFPIMNCLKLDCQGLISDIPDKAVKLRNRYLKI
jgi:glycerophosphoryl diester phosphodiesterase